MQGHTYSNSHFTVMELLHYFFLLTFLLFLLKLISFGYLSRNKSSSVEKLPPGPWKLPIIGSMHHLRGSLLHRTLKELANRYGPIMHLQLGEISTIVVSSPSAAKEIMKTHDIIFASRPKTFLSEIVMYGRQDLAFAPYGEYWRQMRKLCVLELLSAKRVQSFQSIREEEVCKFVDDIFSSHTTSINISKKFNALTNDISARATFGKICKHQNKFLSTVKRVAELASASNVAELFPSSKLVFIISGIQWKMKKCHDDYDNIIESIINERKENNTFAKKTGEVEPRKEDLLDVLLRLQEDTDPAFPFTTDNTKAVIFDVFSAGTETSSTTMEWVMSELMKNPKVMQRAQEEVRKVLSGKGKVTEDDIDELNYLELVIKETLRLHPPVPLLVPRESMKSCEIQGYRIPEKTRVVVNAWAIGRDPKHWDDAETFLPERFDGNSIDFKGNNLEYTPFGAGRRVCPGILFAMATIKLPLAHLLYYFDWELPYGTRPNDLNMTETTGIISSRKTNLHLLAIPRIPFATHKSFE